MAGGLGAVFSAFGAGTVAGLEFTVLFTTSRFTYHNVFTALGIMESLALLFFSLAVIWAIRFYRLGKNGDVVLALVSFFLCIHTHERYVAVFPFLSLLFMLRPETSIKTRIELALLPVLVVVLNVLEKKYLLNADFMIATNGAHIAINYNTIFAFMRSGLYNMMGFNTGLSYLSCFDFRQLPNHLGYWPGVLVSAGFALLTVCYIIKEGRKAVMPVVLFLILIIPLLLTSCVAIVQEFRWLSAANIVLIAGVLAMAGVLWKQEVWGKIAKIALILFFIGEIFVNV